ncbi:hypothetical protein ABZY58_11450 [Micromonospora tulbaghiae]|uniref:hypothetical protein n=1 Tax=Micromonospora tulbaghiae TaxID=479978 RepID=UPI0033A6D005
MAGEHPLKAGVTVIYTCHLGPFLSALRGEMTLAAAADRAALLDRLAARFEHEQSLRPAADPCASAFRKLACGVSGQGISPRPHRKEPVMAKRFTTRQDVIEQDILPALGEHGDDYDTDAICREAYEYRVDTDGQGNELLNTAGFEQIVTDDEFWEIVAKHDKTA